MKKEEYSIFIEEMADLGDEWTEDELEGTSYSKMSLMNKLWFKEDLYYEKFLE